MGGLSRGDRVRRREEGGESGWRGTVKDKEGCRDKDIGVACLGVGLGGWWG